MAIESNHPIPCGALVAVFITTIQDRQPLEGEARILSPFGDEPHPYLVQFASEALPQVRFVYPEWQRCTGRTYKILANYRQPSDPALSRAALMGVRMSPITRSDK